MRRLWYRLRDIEWTAVLALAVGTTALVLAIVGVDSTVVLATALGAVSLAIVSTRG
jgi:hypothetical protein